jgi:heptaprenyl diphosphate synthase
MAFGLPWAIERQLEEVELYIREATTSRQSIIRTAAVELASSGGKRLRPAFALLGGQFGERSDPTLPKIAASSELLHMATLVHDDIIDDAAMRRNNPTVQSKYGKDIAVFTGDYLLTKALLLVSQARYDERMRDLARVMTFICEGEVAQYASRYTMPGLLSYLRRIRGKTAALFALSIVAGAKQCEASDEICRHLGKYGLWFGMAFQIQDDILDYTAQQREIGKPVGHDVLSGVYTLPLIFAARSQRLGWAISDLLATRDKVASPRVVDLVKRAGGVAQAERWRDGYILKALKALDPLPEIEAKEALRRLPEHLFQVNSHV